MTVRIDVQDWRELHLHQECFEIWDDERLKDAARPSRYQILLSRSNRFHAL